MDRDLDVDREMVARLLKAGVASALVRRKRGSIIGVATQAFGTRSSVTRLVLGAMVAGVIVVAVHAGVSRATPTSRVLDEAH